MYCKYVFNVNECITFVWPWCCLCCRTDWTGSAASNVAKIQQIKNVRSCQPEHIRLSANQIWCCVPRVNSRNGKMKTLYQLHPLECLFHSCRVEYLNNHLKKTNECSICELRNLANMILRHVCVTLVWNGIKPYFPWELKWGICSHSPRRYNIKSCQIVKVWRPLFPIFQHVYLHIHICLHART